MNKLVTKHTRVYLIWSIMVVLLMISCEDQQEDQQFPGTFKATLNNEIWEAEKPWAEWSEVDLAGFRNEGVILFDSAADINSFDKTLMMSVKPVGNSFELQNVLYLDGFDEYDLYDSTLNISRKSYDEKNKYLSGTFECWLKEQSSDKFIHITNGEFALPYH